MRYQLEKSMGLMSVSRADGTTIAELDKSFWSERATVVIEGRPWSFGKDGGARTGICESDPALRLSATRPSFWRQGWQVTSGSTTYEIKPAGVFISAYDVFRDGTAIGASGKGSFWTNKPWVDVPDDVPAADAVFLLWIAFLMRARAAQSAASAST
ncbi:hypothetical protein [Nocardioides sp. Root140]|uniref:hypothetical protein n=1 Tax=Nocardioides sp. Root140 TaxID=1736460 RepID=UPI000B274F1E|nr:hypothetical protein [Nocardioides sp. Root140]